MATRPITAFRVLLLVASILGSPLSAQDASEQHEEREAPPSEFQQQLDAHGIPLSLPERGKAILVNIPAFELVAFEDASPVFRSRVIVGAPWHRTPRRETYTSTVRFRPTWRPTPNMVASGKYRDRIWPSGPDNPLGLAAVRLEPGLLVYLHDTNRRELFAEETRALSHGCVRVEQWDRLVSWLLDMPFEEVHRIANGSRTIDYPTENVPVQLAYFLQFPDGAGKLVEYEDIYNLGPPEERSEEHSASEGVGVACSTEVPD